MSLHRLFILTIVILTIFGLIMVASASSFQAQRDFGNSLYLFFRQLLQGVLLGGGGFLLAYFIPIRFIKKLIIPAFLFTFLLLILVFVPGIGFAHGGSYRWVHMAGFSFQPSEFAKITLIFYLAGWLATHKSQLLSFSKGFLPALFMSAAIPFLILLEPNISNFGITSILIIMMFFIAGARLLHLFSLVLLIGIVASVAIIFLPSRLERIQSLFNPYLDPKGTSYQLNQSLIAIGSGGLFGKGLGMSKQKYAALPEVSGDAIFAVVAEELGFIGSTFLVMLYFVLLIEGIFITKRSHDSFSQYFTIGFVSLISLQAFINIGAISGLLPLTGVTLPFISFGGSSLASFLIASGVVAKIAKSV